MPSRMPDPGWHSQWWHLREKKSYAKLFLTHHRANFYYPGAGFTGVILILPAGIARPTPAENALAELGDRVRRAAEIAHVLGEAVGVLQWRFPLLSHHRNLFFQLTEAIRGLLTFWRFLSEPVLFPRCQAGSPGLPVLPASRIHISLIRQGVLHPVLVPCIAVP